MEKEIRVPKWGKIALYVLAALFAVVAFVMLIVVLFSLDDEDKTVIYVFFLPGAIVFTGIAAYFIQYARKWHMIISAESIKEVGVFKTKEIAMDDVKGYTSDGKHLHIMSATTGKRAISLTLQTGKNTELLNWVQSTFRNLDHEELQANEAAALQDESLGATEEERLAKLEQARKVAKVFQVLGAGVIIWAFFFPQPYNVLCLSACALPLLTLMPYYWFGGILKLNQQKNSAYPSLIIPFIAGPLAIFIRAVFDFSILEYTNVWLYAVGIALVYMAVLFANRKAAKLRNPTEGIFLIGFLSLVALAYGWGATIFINCNYDNSIAIQHVVHLNSKHESHSKHTSYNLELEGNGAIPKGSYEVDADTYSMVEEGDDVHVYEFKGKLHIPWILITK